MPVTIKQSDPDVVRLLEDRHGTNKPVTVLYDPAEPKNLLLLELL